MRIVLVKAVLFNFFALLISLFLLIKGSNFFTRSAKRIGYHLGFPSFIVGVLLISIGTSLPELASSIKSVFDNSSEFVIGTVLGSNIANILLILSIAAIMGKSLHIKRDLMKIDLPFLLGSSFLLALMIWDSHFNIGEAIILLLCLGLYLLNSFLARNKEEELKKEQISFKDWFLLIISPILIFLGAKFTVTSVKSISEYLKFGTEIIAMSIVGLGTSLPEVCVIMSKETNTEMKIGAIIGSNIFNTFAVIGIPALFGTLNIPREVLNFPLPVFLISTFLCIIITVDRRINQWQGGLLLIFYIFFIGRLFNFI